MPNEQPATAQIRILFLSANPQNTDRLALDREYRDIDAALRSAGLRDQVELVSTWAVRVRDLQSALLRHQPTIVHFSGHGTQTDGIVLADDGITVTGKALAQLFRAIARDVRLVVLNSCWSAEQAQAIAAAVGSVVGMRYAVSDEAAIEFAQSLYEALAYGRVLQDAFDVAVARLTLLNLADGPALGDPSHDTINPRLVVADDVNPSRLQLIG
jgi:CHAT domain-containing protein